MQGIRAVHMSEAPGAGSDLLSLRDVSHSFPSATGNEPVLRNVSADVRPGETVLMVFTSGAGKTTLLTLAVITDNTEVLAAQERLLRAEEEVVRTRFEIRARRMDLSLKMGKPEEIYGK